MEDGADAEEWDPPAMEAKATGAAVEGFVASALRPSTLARHNFSSLQTPGPQVRGSMHSSWRASMRPARPQESRRRAHCRYSGSPPLPRTS